MQNVVTISLGKYGSAMCHRNATNSKYNPMLLFWPLQCLLYVSWCHQGVLVDGKKQLIVQSMRDDSANVRRAYCVFREWRGARSLHATEPFMKLAFSLQRVISSGQWRILL